MSSGGVLRLLACLGRHTICRFWRFRLLFRQVSRLVHRGDGYNRTAMKKLASAIVLCLFLTSALLWVQLPKWRGAQNPEAVLNQLVQDALSAMTLDQKIAALFMVRPEELGDLTAPGDHLEENYSSYPVSGVIFFAKNLIDAEQTKEYIADMQLLSGIPLLIATDQEGGRISRFSPETFDVPVLPSMYEIGQSGRPERAYEAMKATGESLKALGFNVDFAPVADIWSNPLNTVIGDRAFASTADGVAPFVRQAVRGLEDASIASCVKHFPGHGETEADTHTGTAVSNVDARTLRERELGPFAAGIEEGCPMVMVAHIKLPNVTGDDLPASLSPAIVQGILRDEMGFEGVVITDSLQMGAVTEFFSPEEAPVMALKAGCDILLMPEDLPRAFNGIKAAVEAGQITESRIDESVLRILKLRLKYGVAAEQ